MIAVVSALAVSTPVAAATTPALALTTLTVAPATVTGPAGAAVSTVVTWTVTDTDPTATTVSGTVTIRLQGNRPGSYLGIAHLIPYQYNRTGSGGATFLTGTPQNSSYSDIFAIPQYAATPTATWVVTDLTITDDRGHSSDNGDKVLSRFHRSVVDKVELIDTTPPSLSNVALTSSQPFVLANGSAFTESYSLTMEDYESGVWKGSATITGPGGRTLTGQVEFVPIPSGGGTCGTTWGWGDQYVNCDLQITFPADAAVGTWSVSSVTLTDNAGNAKTYPNLNGAFNAASFVLTADKVINAHNFSTAPNPVNNWSGPATTQLTFAVSGASNGISTVNVTLDGGCAQTSTAPVINPDGTISVPLVMQRWATSCSVTGIAVTDGAGDVSIYGSLYQLPDLGLTITQVPDTPPTVTSASMNTSTVPTSPSSQNVAFTAVISAIAPVYYFSSTLYDSTGKPVPGSSSTGGLGYITTGPAQLFVDLPGNIAPGTYTVGFTITDIGYLSTTYGVPGGQPVPGGPLTLTVTSASTA